MSGEIDVRSVKDMGSIITAASKLAAREVGAHWIDRIVLWDDTISAQVREDEKLRDILSKRGSIDDQMAALHRLACVLSFRCVPCLLTLNLQPGRSSSTSWPICFRSQASSQSLLRSPKTSG